MFNDISIQDNLDFDFVIISHLFDRCDYNNNCQCIRAPYNSKMSSLEELYENAGDSILCQSTLIKDDNYDLEFQMLLEKIYNELSPENKTIFQMLLDGYSCNYIADKLGKPASTIRSRKAKIQKTIAPFIKD